MAVLSLIKITKISISVHKKQYRRVKEPQGDYNDAIDERIGVR